MIPPLMAARVTLHGRHRLRRRLRGASRRRRWSSPARNRSTASCRSDRRAQYARVDSAAPTIACSTAPGHIGHPHPAATFRRARRVTSSMPTITDLEGPAGPLEALLDEPPSSPRATVVFAHPHPQHGGTMHTKAVYQGAKALTRVGCAVLRFNFRGVGRSAGTFDQRRRREGRFPGRARLHGARAIPGLPCGPPASRSARGSRSKRAPSTTGSRR